MTKILKAVSLAALVAALLTTACARTPDEVQVRQAIEKAVSAAERGDAGDLGSVLDKDFEGNAGELDRRQLTGMLRVQHLRGEKLRVLLGPVNVESRGDRLVASFTVTLGGGGRMLPERLGVYQVETAWKHEAGDWLCYSATWKRKV